MAEGIARAMAGDRFEVFSAGSEPTLVHPLALRVLHERGIDATTQRSKSLGEFLDQPFDYVITLCVEEVCPVFPGAVRRLHWPLPDPAAVPGPPEKQLAAFRQTADELTRRLDELLNGDAKSLT